MTVDVLSLAAHPDDTEITAGGLLLTLKHRGHTTGAIDFTKGEFGSNGTAADRMAECDAATKILELDVRINLGFPDGHLSSYDTEAMKETVVKHLRTLKPKLLILPDRNFRHPDHGVVARIGHDAWFYAGLAKYISEVPPHRPKLVVYTPQHRKTEVSFIVNVSDVAEKKLEAIAAYRSQLFSDNEKRTETPLAHADFLERIRASMRHYGAMIGAAYGEPYYMDSPVPLNDVFGGLGL
ncbi:MAG: bacillithiol biosynthesis deacetylase BshB1 [Spirochaetes bacterium]|nr:bacillithiol biosynthesis deacetylase BshB1 [Spirochaetota bacterium]